MWHTAMGWSFRMSVNKNDAPFETYDRSFMIYELVLSNCLLGITTPSGQNILVRLRALSSSHSCGYEPDIFTVIYSVASTII